MSSPARTECIRSLIKFKRQEQLIEKTLENFLENMKLEPEIMRVVKNDRSCRMLERRKLANSLRASILDVKKFLRDIKLSVCDMQENRKIDVDIFRERLIFLANKIRELKKDHSIESLGNEEIELDQDMRVFSLALAKYENRASCECKKSTECLVTNHHDYREARDFDALIAKTGHTQNWSESDHLFFLKVRKNSQNVASMVSSIRKKCPDLTAERIVNHEAWYKIYLDLREKQRTMIREWRKNRDTMKREKIMKNFNDDENPVETIDDGVTNRENIVNDSDSSSNVSNNRVNIGKTSDKMTSDKREFVKKWRNDREKANLIENEESRLRIESGRALKENRRLTRARAIKSTVDAYRQKKMENTASSSTSVTDFERFSSKSKDPKLIESFRRQDEEFLKRRKALLQRKKSNTIGILCSKVHSRSSIELSTLMNPTKVWLEKCKAVKDPHQEVLSRGVSYVKYIPKLGTCNWRNQEST